MRSNVRPINMCISYLADLEGRWGREVQAHPSCPGFLLDPSLLIDKN
jgi:hypothetical protein